MSEETIVKARELEFNFKNALLEIERLNNIINKLEKHCETMLSIFEQMTDEQRQEQLDKYKIYDGFLSRLQELKGNNNGAWVNNLLEVIKENNIEFGSNDNEIHN